MVGWWGGEPAGISRAVCLGGQAAWLLGCWRREPLQGGWPPTSVQARRTAWASRRTGLRHLPARSLPIPHCDASRARPSVDRDSRYIAKLRNPVKNKVGTFFE